MFNYDVCYENTMNKYVCRRSNELGFVSFGYGETAELAMINSMRNECINLIIINK